MTPKDNVLVTGPSSWTKRNGEECYHASVHLFVREVGWVNEGEYCAFTPEEALQKANARAAKLRAAV